MKMSREKHLSPVRTAISRIWQCCYLDKGLFGHDKISITQAEISQKCKESGMVQTDLKLVPLDPGATISITNSALVDKIQRKEIVEEWLQRKDRDFYSAVVMDAAHKLSELRSEEIDCESSGV